MSLRSSSSSSQSSGLYEAIRPHHLLGLCAVVRLASSSRLARRLSDYLLTKLSALSDRCLPLIYQNVVPDCFIRCGIRVQLRHRLLELRRGEEENDVETALADKQATVRQLTRMPVAVATAAANEQHYEVPAAFYDLCLGPAKKYSSGLWPTPTTTLAESEQAMLRLYCERAGVRDGAKVVDLGCGWGSLTLHLAEHYPNCQITGISNSRSQREYILQTAAERGLNVRNIKIVTCNVSDDKGALKDVKNNDLVMTVEMFEHMKNYNDLLKKVYGFLKPEGKLFVHIFTHKDYAYQFEDGWMSDNFFTGGTMPSDDLLLYFAQDFACVNHWRVNGTHYSRTSEAWLATLDANWKNGKLAPILAQAYGEGKENEWYHNWRLFYLACAELWGFNNGQEWIVSHYLFQRR